MKAIMEGDAQWHAFNFPENESNAQAHARCSSPEKAKKYCPVRWKGIKKWGNVRTVIVIRTTTCTDNVLSFLFRILYTALRTSVYFMILGASREEAQKL